MVGFDDVENFFREWGLIIILMLIIVIIYTVFSYFGGSL